MDWRLIFFKRTITFDSTNFRLVFGVGSRFVSGLCAGGIVNWISVK